MSEYEPKLPTTYDDMRRMLGLKPISEILSEEGNEAYREGWSNKSGDLDFRYLRTEARTREDGITEMVIYIPFEVDGLL